MLCAIKLPQALEQTIEATIYLSGVGAEAEWFSRRSCSQ